MNYYLVEDDWITSLTPAMGTMTPMKRIYCNAEPDLFSNHSMPNNLRDVRINSSRQPSGNAVHTRKRMCLVPHFNGAQ